MSGAIVVNTAVSIDWMIPRFMPGNPVQTLIGRAMLNADAMELMSGYYMESFGLDVPLWQQYINFWIALSQGDLGTSVFLFPMPVKEALKDEKVSAVAEETLDLE